MPIAISPSFQNPPYPSLVIKSRRAIPEHLPISLVQRVIDVACNTDLGCTVSNFWSHGSAGVRPAKNVVIRSTTHEAGPVVALVVDLLAEATRGVAVGTVVVGRGVVGLDTVRGSQPEFIGIFFV